MSAVRPNSNRRDNRATLSSPYRRSGTVKRRNSGHDANKVKGWGISDFLFGFFKRSAPSPSDVSDHFLQNGSDQEGSEPSDNDMNDDGGASVVEISPPQTQSKHMDPPRTPSLSIEDDQSSSAKVRQVSDFLAENAHRTLNKVEVAGLVSLLEGSVQDDQLEPFRFSPSPLTTPARGASPNANFIIGSSSAPSLPASGSITQTLGKSLAKNPNGVYRWQGAGSARPRTRYQSPGFGPSRSMPIRMKLTPELPTTDKKRRRVGGHNTETSTSQRASAVPFPTSNPATNGQTSSIAGPPAPSVNGTAPSPAGAAAPSSRPNGAVPPTTPRIRTNNLPSKPTAPAVPSPLRQAWNQTDSPSPPHPAPASKPTRAANIMSELIKETTPAPKPDFSNPYESANPVPGKPATRRPVTKRVRAVASSHAEPKKEEKEKKVTELSPQKIIEATVPKGSKRSRPPADLNLSAPRIGSAEPAAPRRSSRLKSPEPPSTNGINGFTRASGSRGKTNSQTIVIEEVSDDESPTKKQKGASPSPGPTNGRMPTVTIEEVDDVEMSASSKPSSSRVTRPAQVVEPEENPQPRQRSLSPTASTSPTSPVRNPFGLKSSAPKAPSKLRYSIQVEGETEKEENNEEADKGKAAPSFASFDPPATSTSISLSPVSSTSPSPPVFGIQRVQSAKAAPKTEDEVKATVLAMPVTELPTFTFIFTTSSPGAGPGPSSQKSRDAAKAVATTSLPTFDFSPSALAASVATSKPSKPSTRFDFSAAGMKLPAASGDAWDCSICMLKSPASATECTVCGEPRISKPAREPAPVLAFAPAPAATGFNWAAAGMKKPESGGGWTCSMCMLLNPASATSKCSFCDVPR